MHQTCDRAGPLVACGDGSGCRRRSGYRRRRAARTCSVRRRRVRRRFAAARCVWPATRRACCCRSGSAALLFRHLGVVDGGRYVTVLALVATVQGLTDFGLTAIGMRELVRAGGRRARAGRARGDRAADPVDRLGGAGAVAFAALAGYGGVLVLGTALAASACSSRTSRARSASR